MENNNTRSIDHLLRKLPEVHTSVNFTESVMSRIAALPEKTAWKPKPWQIAFIIIASLLLTVLGGWAISSFWDVEFTLLHRIGQLFTETGLSYLSLFKDIHISFNILSGLTCGVFLLLLDTWFRNKQRKQHIQEAS